MRDKALVLVAVIGAVAIGVTLTAWGQPIISRSSRIEFWVGSVFSSQNSQQIADWYTLSHVVHGIAIVLLGRWLIPGASLRLLGGAAIVTGVAWEIVEHTDWVLEQFRATTINQGYVGDSVLNAVMDYVWMLGGFAVAWRSSAVLSLALIATLEASAALIARDSLILTILMLVYPVEAVDQWQQAINPLTNSPQTPR